MYGWRHIPSWCAATPDNGDANAAACRQFALCAPVGALCVSGGALVPGVGVALGFPPGVGPGSGLRYVTLPQYLAPTTPVLLEDFESAAEWSPVFCSVSDDTAQRKSGAQGIKQYTDDSKTASTMSKTTTLDLSNFTHFRYRAYNYAETDNIDAIRLYLAQDSFSKWYSVSETAWHTMWNAYQVDRAAFLAEFSPDWAQPFTNIRLRINSAVDVRPQVTFDTLQAFESKPLPAIMLLFDDSRISTYTQAFAYLQPRRIPATSYTITSQIGTAGNMTTEHLLALDADGWDVGNHSHSHVNFTTLTQSQIEDELTAAQAVLDGLGLTRASRHVAYPYGGFNGTTIAAMAAAEMLTGRITLNTRQPICPPSDNYTIECQNIADTTTLAQARGYIDQAIEDGTVCALLWHSLTETPASEAEWSIANFQALVDYIVSQHIQPITISQFYALQSGPIQVVQPW